MFGIGIWEMVILGIFGVVGLVGVNMLVIVGSSSSRHDN
jgi:hypothetical protein